MLTVEEIARRLVWWEQDSKKVPTDYLLRKIMELGTWEMIVFARKTFGEAAMKEAFMKAQPGDFSPRSWTYWHIMFDIRPERPMPKRKFLEEEEMK